MGEQEGWQEWSKFVLKELERLNENYEKLNSKLEETIIRRQETSNATSS